MMLLLKLVFLQMLGWRMVLQMKVLKRAYLGWSEWWQRLLGGIKECLVDVICEAPDDLLEGSVHGDD